MCETESEYDFVICPNGFRVTAHGLIRVDREVDLVRPEPRCAIVVKDMALTVVLEPGLIDVEEVCEGVAEIGNVFLHTKIIRSRLEAICIQIDAMLARLYECNVVCRTRFFDDYGRMHLGEWTRAH
jgi:hypothetical protein